MPKKLQRENIIFLMDVTPHYSQLNSLLQLQYVAQMHKFFEIIWLQWRLNINLIPCPSLHFDEFLELCVCNFNALIFFYSALSSAIMLKLESQSQLTAICYYLMSFWKHAFLGWVMHSYPSITIVVCSLVCHSWMHLLNPLPTSTLLSSNCPCIKTQNMQHFLNFLCMNSVPKLNFSCVVW